VRPEVGSFSNLSIVFVETTETVARQTVIYAEVEITVPLYVDDDDSALNTHRHQSRQHSLTPHSLSVCLDTSPAQFTVNNDKLVDDVVHSLLTV